MITKSPFKSGLVLLFYAFVIMFSGCGADDFNDSIVVPPLQAKPDGNVVLALNNNVLIEFPPGAVQETVNIEINACGIGRSCDFLLDMISIQPEMTFEVPVTIQLNYEGELVCNELSPEECNLVICHWPIEFDYLNRLDYENRVNVECICCAIDTVYKTISFTTLKTGLFGLSLNNFTTN